MSDLNDLRSLIDADPAAAETELRERLRNRSTPSVYRLLGRALRAQGKHDEAAAAERSALDAAARHPELAGAIRQFQAGNLAQAERAVRRYLAQEPEDAAGLCLLADIAERVGIFPDALRLLDDAQKGAPAFSQIKVRRANLLFQMGRTAEALTLLGEIPLDDDQFLGARLLSARIHGLVGDYDRVERIYRDLLDRFPADAAVWCGLGDVLKTLGRAEGAIDAFRKALEIEPHRAYAWWSISNMKSVRFEEREVIDMRQSLHDAQADEERIFLHFALGKALEDEGNFAGSMQHYMAANSLKRRIEPYDRNDTTQRVAECTGLFGNSFLEERAGVGCPSPDPIFIVGMPRAGSTLIEQMLSSHSKIEGTSELAEVPLLVNRLLSERWRDRSASFPGLLKTLPFSAFAELGLAYLEAARAHRKTDRPFFIDKLPNNWIYVGFIHLILPNAKIIDVRRAPMACCFSNFKQHFAQGQLFSNDLEDVGTYYRDYVMLMRHFDQVLPGMVYRLFHEDVVAAPDRETRELIGWLGLEYEDGILNFHSSARAVRTASAEQVRRPINAEGIDRWRAFAPYLAPLERALGFALEDYR